MIISLQVYPLQQAFQHDFSCLPVKQEYSSSFVVSAPKAASRCLHSLKQPARSLLSRKGVFWVFRYKSESYYSLFTIQARVYCSWSATIQGYYSKIPFCLFKEARASFVSALHFRLFSPELMLCLLSSFSLIM